jgi:hypothetical protein
MSDADNYRANVAACRRRADESSEASEKRAWLDMAESWRLLLICSEVLPVRENTEAAAPARNRTLPWPEVLTRIVGPGSMIRIPRMREWLTRKAWF